MSLSMLVYIDAAQVNDILMGKAVTFKGYNSEDRALLEAFSKDENGSAIKIIVPPIYMLKKSIKCCHEFVLISSLYNLE